GSCSHQAFEPGSVAANILSDPQLHLRRADDSADGSIRCAAGSELRNLRSVVWEIQLRQYRSRASRELTRPGKRGLSHRQISHALKFGGRYLRHVFNGYSAFPVRGNYDFNGQFTRQVGTTTAATAIADFALGQPDAISRAYLAGTFGMRFYGLAGFAEDTWRATKNLTLTLGLRYEIQSPPYEVYDRWANF